jgi:hypothetical protein
MEHKLDVVFYDEKFIRLSDGINTVVIPWGNVGILSVFGGNYGLGLKDGRTSFQLPKDDWKRLESVWPLFLDGHPGIQPYNKDA